MHLAGYPLAALADKVGTPFYLYDAQILHERLAKVAALTEGPALKARYAMKANSSWHVLEAVRGAGLWIDAVSGNEVLRARRAGFAMGSEPPVVMLTVDVFRDNALTTVLEHSILANVGSPGMIEELRGSGYRGGIAFRVNPGFGHGHVQSCDTGGPSSKHGLWLDDARAHPRAGRRRQAADRRAARAHRHRAADPRVRREHAQAGVAVRRAGAELPDLEAVNLGGGIPHPYRPGAQEYDLAWYRPVLVEAAERLAKAARRPIRVEIEPGRYPVAAMGLVARVKDIKETAANAKGPGHRFVMVDAGFVDLVRPAMYGAYHHISIVGAGANRPPEPLVVAGPLCESGDVFTRDDHELLVPRQLGRPDVGDLLVLHDAGAYGAAMSSNYVSIGRVPQVWWEDGRATLIARRETLEDIQRTDCDEPL